MPGESERDGYVHGFVKAPLASPDALTPSTNRVPVKPGEAVDLIRSQAARDALTNFEERAEQTAMARVIGETLNDGGQLIVEAGTGVGKSLAYLIPSALHAVRNNARTVISTNTINLQEQLTGQDIPIARRILASAGIDESALSVAQLKGRANYLCLLRWAAMQRAAALTSDEARMAVRLLFWLGATDSGDRAELQLRREEDAPWARVSAHEGGCMTMQCAYVRDGSCFLYRAKKRADAAHLLVVNHALLLSDIAAGGNVLPEYKHLVIDEAHHLEEQATNQFGFSAGEAELLSWLDLLHLRGGRGVESGLASTAVTAHARFAADSQRRIADPGYRPDAAQAVTRARDAVPPFFQNLRTFAQEHSNARGDTDDRISINRGIRVQPDWADIESAWFEVDEDLAKVCSVVEELSSLLSKADAKDILDRDAVLAEANELYERGEALRAGISRIIGKDDRATVCWMTMGRQEHAPVLSSAPLSVAETLNTALFTPKDSVVLTSATLTTDDSFGYIKERLGVQDARELSLGSPFDYRQSTLLLMPTDMPEPDQPGYAAAVQSALIESVQASEGRALVLFTSHAALRTAYNGIKRPLEEQEILVLAQGIDGPPKQLLATLRDSPRVVVLGAASFWEGVDVTGEALSLLVVARLPFPVPSEPVFQARSELFEQPFEQYARAAGDPALQAGLRTPDPQPQRPRRRHRARPAVAQPQVRRRVPALAAGMHAARRHRARPPRRSGGVARPRRKAGDTVTVTLRDGHSRRAWLDGWLPAVAASVGYELTESPKKRGRQQTTRTPDHRARRRARRDRDLAFAARRCCDHRADRNAAGARAVRRGHGSSSAARERTTRARRAHDLRAGARGPRHRDVLLDQAGLPAAAARRVAVRARRRRVACAAPRC